MAKRRFDTGGRLRRGAYLLPSLFTIGNMTLGFYAIVLALRSAGLPFPPGTPPAPRFGLPALLVFVAGILDSLDGRLARMTGTESDFGKEYDSLADVITFGIAPALLTYLWGVKELAPQIWLVPMFYLVCVATRLARFNVQTRVVDSRYFVGLPSPAGAGTVCSLLFFAPDALPPGLRDAAHQDHWRLIMQWTVTGALLLTGLLMVSTFRYQSFKKLDFLRTFSYRSFIILAGIVLGVVYLQEAVFLLIALLYTISGPALYLWQKIRRRPPSLPGSPPS